MYTATAWTNNAQGQRHVTVHQLPPKEPCCGAPLSVEADSRGIHSISNHKCGYYAMLQIELKKWTAQESIQASSTGSFIK